MTTADTAADTAAARPAAVTMPLKPQLEAILMIADEPLAAGTLASVVEYPEDQVQRALAELSTEYSGAGRGFDLRQVGGGWRFYSRADYAPVVERFVVDGQQTRLTQAALETLAVVAYRQPISRARVSAIRGVSVDAVMQRLVSMGLVDRCGTDPHSGAHLFATTAYFLERMGLASLDELPDIAPFLPELADVDDV